MASGATPCPWGVVGVLLLLVVLMPHPPAALPRHGIIVKRTTAEAVGDRGDGENASLREEPTPHSINTIHLVGERHSGTKWMTQHLEDCFGSQLKVVNRYTRYKHWFQYDDRNEREPHSALVVAMFRNPYDWLDAMRRKPYHSPQHFDLDWHPFVTTPWTMARGSADRLLLESGHTDNATCMHRFSFHDAVPCSPSDRNMFGTYHGKTVGVLYELRRDGSGRPYDSIAGLRRDKIANFLGAARFAGVAALLPVQFEFAVSRGTRELIDKIGDLAGLRARCERAPPRPLRARNLDAGFVDWVTEHVDWEVEELVGYGKRG